MTNALEIKGLCKDYGDFRLENVDLVLPGGSIMGLIGENGAGKSTTLKCIMGLVRPDGGTIRALGREEPGADREIREDIGVVWDEVSFHDPLTISQMEKVLSTLFKRWDGPLFHSYLTKFQLPERKKLKEFSRGMKMKLSIAAALAHHPRLLLLDEATSGLDPVVRNEILDEFLGFIQDEDHAVLISSHITSDLERVADYVTYLHRGRAVLQGAKDELLEEYGRLACARSDLQKVEREYLVGVRTSQFGCEALIKRKREFCFRYPQLTVDPVSLEDIMVFTVKGDSQ